MPSHSRLQLEEWLGAIMVSGKILDVGGAQKPIKNRIKKMEGCEFTILDLEKPHELKQKPDIIEDINLYRIPSIHHFEKYDIAFCIEVSEYLFNPIMAIKNIKEYLKPDGILYMSFPFIYPVHEPVEFDYLRYTPRGVEKLMEEAGFEIIETTPKILKHPGFINTLIFGEQMKPAKNYPNHSWQGVMIKAKKL